MSASVVNELMTIWDEMVEQFDTSAPFSNAKDLLSTIDSIDVGGVPWVKRYASYSGPVTANSPSWQRRKYEVFHRDPDKVIANILANPDFDGLIDYQPYKEFSQSGQRRYNEFMSGKCCWEQAVRFSYIAFMFVLTH